MILGSARAFACWRLCPAIANFSLTGRVGFKVAHLPFRWRLGTPPLPVTNRSSRSAWTWETRTSDESTAAKWATAFH